jgi:parallel beta-helix repeat protein
MSSESHALAIASVVGTTITGNRMDGILVERHSHAEIGNNTIRGNQGNGITVLDSNSVILELPGLPQSNKTDADSPNRGLWSFGHGRRLSIESPRHVNWS